MLRDKAPPFPKALWWECFWDLNTMRPIGMGPGPIPVDKMHWYAKEELQLDDDERSAFVWIMRRADGCYLEAATKQAKSSTK